MRQFGIGFAGLALAFACPCMAQDQQAGTTDNRIDWELPADQADDEADRQLEEYLRARDTERQRECGTSDADLLVVGAAGRPRYDDNGALIREPASTCGTTYSRSDAATSNTATRTTGLIVEQESSGGCTEDRLTGTRTCRSSGSITVGNDAEANERTRQAVDDMLDRLQQD